MRNVIGGTLFGLNAGLPVEVLWNENIPHVKSKLKWADIFGDYHPWFTVKSFAGDYKPPPKSGLRYIQKAWDREREALCFGCGDNKPPCVFEGICPP